MKTLQFFHPGTWQDTLSWLLVINVSTFHSSKMNAKRICINKGARCTVYILSCFRQSFASNSLHVAYICIIIVWTYFLCLRSIKVTDCFNIFVDNLICWILNKYNIVYKKAIQAFWEKAYQSLPQGILSTIRMTCKHFVKANDSLPQGILSTKKMMCKHYVKAHDSLPQGILCKHLCKSWWVIAVEKIRNSSKQCIIQQNQLWQTATWL